MISSQAMYDIKVLISTGAELTPVEIITLNELSNNIKTKNDGTESIYAPRVAWASDIPLYEMGIGASLWYYGYACRHWHGKSLTMAMVWACANSRETGFIDNFKNGLKVRFFNAFREEGRARKEIKRWYRRVGATDEELKTALDYVINDISVDEFEDDKESDISAFSYPEGCPYTELINDAISKGLGLSLSEIETMPASQLNDILYRWTRNQIALNGGNEDDLAKAVKASATGKYFKYLTKLQAKYGKR